MVSTEVMTPQFCAILSTNVPNYLVTHNLLPGGAAEKLYMALANVDFDVLFRLGPR